MTTPWIPVVHGAALDRPDEADTIQTAGHIRDALVRLGNRSDVVPVGPDLAGLEAVLATRPDLVFNLVEAIGGDGALAGLVPAELDRRGIRYTGSRARVMRACIDKVATKRNMIDAGLPTPAWSLTGDDLPEVPTVIVKSLTEHASVGIDARSVVPRALASAEIAAREGRYGGRFFAEAYVDGREFNLSVLDGRHGPEVLPPAEIEFVGFPADRPRIVDYEAKWEVGSFAFENTPRRFGFPPADRKLLKTLSGLARKTWDLFDLSGYARIDFRVDATGRPWILEVNTNPCLAPDAGFFAAAAVAGLGYDDLIARIVEPARGTLSKVA